MLILRVGRVRRGEAERRRPMAFRGDGEVEGLWANLWLRDVRVSRGEGGTDREASGSSASLSDSDHAKRSQE